MKVNQSQVLKWVGLSEGGYVNHPNDPGGPTDRGITQKTYDAWNRLNKRPLKTVRGISKSEADEILVSQYFTPVRFNDLPSGLDYAVVDFAINSGPSRAVKELQKVLGVTQDGIMGIQTLSAIRKKNLQELIIDYCIARLSFMKRLKNWPSFRKGWTIRVMGKYDGVQSDDIGVIDRAVRMSRAVKAPDPVISVPHKADEKNVKVFSLIAEAIMKLFGGK
jgi:lysozyme family protein